MVGFHRHTSAPSGKNDYESWNNEAQEEASDASISQALRQRQEDVVAQGKLVVLVVGVLPGDGANIKTHHQHPNGNGDYGGGADFPHPGVPQWVNHSKVAVDGDAAEKSLAGVKVGVERVDGNQTDVASMSPNTSPQEVHPQEEANGEGQVTQGQMEQVDTQVVLLSYVLTRHVQGEGVSRDGDEDDSQVVEQNQLSPEGRLHWETS